MTAACTVLAIDEVHAQSATVTVQGYQYSFENRVETAAGDLNNLPAGTLQIKRISDGKVVYTEETSLQPGCGDNKTVEAVSSDFISFCGNLGGRHFTKKLFRLQPSPVPVAQIDYYDSPAAITAEGSDLRTLVLRRDIFGAKLTGPHYFPVVYKSVDDGVTIGFRPDYGPGSSRRYVDYYKELRNREQIANAYPEMIAALVASGDVSLICSELKLLKKGVASPKEIENWMQHIPEAGYPKFKIQQCVRK